MPIYMKLFKKNEILLKGPINKPPYKWWFELQSAQVGTGQTEPSAAQGSQRRSLSTNINISTTFTDLITFLIGPKSQQDLDAQIDFIAEGSSRAYMSFLLKEAYLMSISTSRQDPDGNTPFYASFNCASITHTYDGPNAPGAPSWTVQATP